MTSTKDISIVFSGDKAVLGNILKKAELLKKKDPAHEKIRPVLLLPGGGQAGVIEAGVVVAMERLGLSEVFDYIVGISTGAAVGYYFLAKETAIGSTVYFDDNVKNKMVNFLHPWKLFDIDTLEKVFRTVKPVNVETVKQSRSTLLIGVTELKTGKGMFLDAKSYDDPIACVVASTSLPVLAGGKAVTIDGKQYVDGGPSFPLPVSYVLEGLDATDVLVVMPQSLQNMEIKGAWVKGMVDMVTRILTPALRRSIEQYDVHFNEGLAYLRGEKPLPAGVRLGVFHAEKERVSAYSMNSEELKKGVFTAERVALEHFAKAQHELLPWWEKIVVFLQNLFHFSKP